MFFTEINGGRFRPPRGFDYDQALREHLMRTIVRLRDLGEPWYLDEELMLKTLFERRSQMNIVFYQLKAQIERA